MILHWLLGLLSIPLGAVLFVQWHDWDARAQREAGAPVAPAAETPGAPLPDAAALLTPPPPREEYATVVERPLFLPDRRPPPPDSAAPPPEPPLLDLSAVEGLDLNAVLIAPGTVSAWVRGPRRPQPTRLRPGDDYEGWRVQEIRSDRLLLENQGTIREIALRDYTNAPPIPQRLPAPVHRLPPPPAAASDPTTMPPLPLPPPTGTSAYAPPVP